MLDRAIPVDADAYWLLIFDCDFDHGAEVGIVFSADADISRIDSILGQRASALRIFLQQDVSVVMEVADDGDTHILTLKLLDNGRDRGSSPVVIYRDSNQLGPGTGQ